MTRVSAETPLLRFDMNYRHPNNPAAIEDHVAMAGRAATAEREPGDRISMRARTC